MAKPKISIIIPAYNEEKYISDCISSLKKQTFLFPYEIIVIDNNSTDNTKSICKKQGVRVFTEKQKGYVFAASKGISLAHADIIALTDADVRVPNTWLQKIYESFINDQKLIAVGGIFTFYDGPLLVRVIVNLCNRINPKLIIASLSGMNMAFLRKAYSAVGGFDTSVNLQADTLLGQKFKKYGKILIRNDNKVSTSARRFKSVKQIIGESWVRSVNAWALKYSNTTIYKNQTDYR